MQGVVCLAVSTFISNHLEFYWQEAELLLGGYPIESPTEATPAKATAERESTGWRVVSVLCGV